jgi:Tol biopolymer transport system component
MGATEPVWSPNGRWIAFVAAVAPDPDLPALDQDPRSPRGRPLDGLEVARSSNSNQLVFNSHGKPEEGEFFESTWSAR